MFTGKTGAYSITLLHKSDCSGKVNYV